MTPLPPPVSDDWIRLLDVYGELIHVLLDPEDALRDIQRELRTGRVRSMRRRSLAEGVSDTELERTYWRDVKLFPYRDGRGRDTIQLRPTSSRYYNTGHERTPPDGPLPPGVFDAVVRPAGGPRIPEPDLSGAYYLHRDDCIKRWPFLVPVDAGDIAAAAAIASKKVDEAIRKAIGKVYDQATEDGKKPPNIVELADLVHPHVPQTTKRHIREIGNESEFKIRRRPRGKRWHGN
jgi:hypothetical protein